MTKRQFWASLGVAALSFVFAVCWFWVNFTMVAHENTMPALQLALRQNYAEVKLVLGFVIGCFLSGSLMKLSWEAQCTHPKRKRLSVCASGSPVTSIAILGEAGIMAGTVVIILC